MIIMQSALELQKPVKFSTTLKLNKFKALFTTNKFGKVYIVPFSILIYKFLYVRKLGNIANQ